MKIRIDFEYDIEYVLARRRTTERALAQASVEVDIEEAPPESARLVFEAGTARYEGLDRGVVNCIPEPRGERPARFYEIDGRLYREYCRIEDLARLTGDADLASPLNVGPKGNPGVGSIIHQGYFGNRDKRVYFTRESIVEKVMKEHYSDRWNPKPVPESGLFRSYRDDAGQSRMPLIHERASELRILGDCVMAPAAEPVIALEHLTSDTHHTAFVVAEISDGAWSRFGVGGHHALYNGSRATFALDDIEGAKAFARTRDMEAGCLDLTSIRTSPSQEIEFDPSYGFRRHALNLRLELAKSVAYMSPASVETFVALRTTERNSPSWTTRPLLEAVMAMNAALRSPGAMRKPLAVERNASADYDYVGAATTTTLKESEWEVERLLASRAGRDIHGSPNELPNIEGPYRAAQVGSAFDRSVILDAMRATDGFPEPSAGDVVVAVETIQKGVSLAEARHEGLFLFDAEGNPVHAVGRGGSRPPAQVAELARMHAARVVSAADRYRADELDEGDLAALSMD